MHVRDVEYIRVTKIIELESILSAQLNEIYLLKEPIFHLLSNNTRSKCSIHGWLNFSSYENKMKKQTNDRN